jgi:hypothetical protein
MLGILRAPARCSRAVTSLRRALAVMAFVAALAACATDVQLIRYPEAAGLTPRAPDCEVRFLDWHARPAPGCADVGDVYVGDLGYALIGCGREQSEEKIRAEACRIGADTAMLRRIRDFHSSCFQARARLLRCAAPAQAAR